MTHQMLQEWHPYSWFGLVPFSVFITNLRNSNIWGEKKYGIKYSIKIIKKNLNLNPCFFPSNSIKLIILYKLGSMNKDLGRSSLTFPSSWLMKKKKKKKKTYLHIDYRRELSSQWRLLSFTFNIILQELFPDRTCTSISFLQLLLKL